MNSKRYYVYYILTNYHNTVLYTGFTEDLIKRIYQHKNKMSDGFTAKYNVEKLVYFEIYEEAMEGIKREKQIKNLLRRKKIDLITGFNQTWKDLYPDII